MPQHRKAQGPTLGKTLIRDRFKSHGRAQEQWVSPADAARVDHHEEALLKSVTASSDLDEFLATATMAGTEFEAERNNLKLVVPNPKDGVMSAGEQKAMKTLHDKHRNLLCIPRRPKWNKTTTPQELDAMERADFLEWRKLLSQLSDIETLAVTPYEKNLEVWKQMWRVLERSDVVVQIVDSRNPLLYWSEDLDKYITELNPKKERIVLVNKADLLPEPQRKEWAGYFNEAGLKAVFFSAIESAEEIDTVEEEDKPFRHEKSPEPVSADNERSEDEQDDGNDDDWVDEESDDGSGDETEEGAPPHSSLPRRNGSLDFKCVPDIYSRSELVDFFKSLYTTKDKVVNGVTTVGFVGYPNVGKSSTLNALMQHKRVSVSSTPGKTKHFQTMYVDPELMLCDSPGLVMPSFAMSAAEMVISGILPIDQMRDYLPPLNLIASRIPRPVLEGIYGISLKFVKEYGIEYLIIPPPTGEELLTAYADKRGFVTARNLPDLARAARYVLKDYVNGRLLYCHAPPQVSQEEFMPYSEFATEEPDLKESDLESEETNATAPIAFPGDNVKTKSGRMNREFFTMVTTGIHQQRNGLNMVRGPIPEAVPGLSTKRHYKRNKKEKLRRIYRDLDVH